MKERNEKDKGRKEGGSQDPVRKKWAASPPERKNGGVGCQVSLERKTTRKRKEGERRGRSPTRKKERQTLTKSIILSMKLKKTTEGNH